VGQPKTKGEAVASGADAAFDAFDEAAQGMDWVPDRQSQVLTLDQHGHASVSTGYSRGTGRRVVLSVGALAIFLGIAIFAVHGLKTRQVLSLEAETSSQAKQPPVVEAVRVSAASPAQTLRLPGEVHGWYRSTIYARVDGYLASWSSDIGDRVKKDQVLATIDTPDIDAQLVASEAQLQTADAELKVKEADAEFANTTYERWRTSPKGAVSEQEREAKKAEHNTTIAQVNVARARVSLARANVDRFKKLIQFKQVTAPFDGVITERRVDIGDLVTAGSTKSTAPLFSISQENRLRVVANVPQTASAQLAVGSEAEVSAPEFTDRRFAGRIARTGRSIDVRARTLQVEIDLANEDLVLVPGMYVQVDFHVKPKGFVQVPASAMIFRGGNPQVAVVKADNTISFQDVSIARDNGKTVEIASGLSLEDRVALNISNQIANGEKVAIQDNSESIPTASR
jgi:RND family efflux transporter MFP subunit